jgi:hypothetical protein
MNLALTYLILLATLFFLGGSALIVDAIRRCMTACLKKSKGTKALGLIPHRSTS